MYEKGLQNIIKTYLSSRKTHYWAFLLNRTLVFMLHCKKIYMAWHGSSSDISKECNFVWLSERITWYFYVIDGYNMLADKRKTLKKNKRWWCMLLRKVSYFSVNTVRCMKYKINIIDRFKFLFSANDFFTKE